MSVWKGSQQVYRENLYLDEKKKCIFNQMMWIHFFGSYSFDENSRKESMCVVCIWEKSAWEMEWEPSSDRKESRRTCYVNIGSHDFAQSCATKTEQTAALWPQITFCFHGANFSESIGICVKAKRRCKTMRINLMPEIVFSRFWQMMWISHHLRWWAEKYTHSEKREWANVCVRARISAK